LKSGGINMIKKELLKTLNFTLDLDLDNYFVQIGHLVVILKQDNTLALFDGDYMEIGEVTETQLKDFIELLHKITNSKT
jgi:hypothetical protein